jgi:transcriptional regulator GlxA family with amidase domain
MKRSTGPMPASVPASSTAIVHRLIDLIEKSYAQRITLASLSKDLRRKPEPLGRLFRQVAGVTVHEYMTGVRLEHAARYLRDGLKIEAVALSVGYKSKKNLYRQFIRRFGVTPEVYRRRRGGDRHKSGLAILPPADQGRAFSRSRPI